MLQSTDRTGFPVSYEKEKKMSYYAGDYDIAVIGAGHAGCEAGLAAARLGMKTLVFSISLGLWQICHVIHI